MRRYTFSNVIYFKFQNILYIYVVIVQNEWVERILGLLNDCLWQVSNGFLSLLYFPFPDPVGIPVFRVSTERQQNEITWCVEMALPDPGRTEHSGVEFLVALGALKFRYYVDRIFAIFTWKLNQAHTDRHTLAHTHLQTYTHGVRGVLVLRCYFGASPSLFFGWLPVAHTDLSAPPDPVPRTSPGHFLIRRRLSVIYVKYFLWKKQWQQQKQRRQQPPTELFCGNKHEI